MTGLEAKVAFSSHIASNALLSEVAKDVASTSSSLFFSLAFLYQTRGEIRKAITKLQKDDQIFSYGISDHPVKGLDLKKPDGKVVVVSPQELSKNLPEPFKKEPTGGGTRLHHKFLVVDFDQPSARVYFGSYNFSGPADTSNGENLLCIRDRRIATTFVVEAVRIFDHYHFRVAQTEARHSSSPSGPDITQQIAIASPNGALHASRAEQISAKVRMAYRPVADDIDERGLAGPQCTFEGRAKILWPLDLLTVTIHELEHPVVALVR